MRNQSQRVSFLLSGVFSLVALALPMALSACTSDESNADLGADLSVSADLAHLPDLSPAPVDGGQAD